MNSAAFEDPQQGAQSDFFLRRNIGFLRNLTAQLDRDGDEYGGHRYKALLAMHAAQHELVAAEQFSRGN